MSTPSAAIVRCSCRAAPTSSARDAFGNTILTAAAVGDDLETIRMVLDAGVDPNTAGVTRITPLVYARTTATRQSPVCCSQRARTPARPPTYL